MTKDGLNKTVVVAIMVTIGLFCLTSIFIAPSYGDEQLYHYPMVQSISFGQASDPHSDYSSAYTPLPYVIGRLAFMLGGSLTAVRMLNFLVFLACVVCFIFLAKKISRDYWALSLLFFLNPYFLRASYMFLLTNWGLLFALLAMNIYVTKKDSRYWLGDSFLGLAVLCQQWMLVIVLGLLLFELQAVVIRKITAATWVKSLLRKTIMLAPAFLLFYSWRGLTHPNFSSHSLRPTFEHVNGVLANIGLVMLCVVLANIRDIFKKFDVVLLFPLPLLWFAIPRHSPGFGPLEITGVVSQLATQVQTKMHFPYQWSMFFFIMAGYFFLLLITRKKESSAPGFLRYALLGFFVAFAVSTRLAASHIFISLPWILLLFHTEIEGMKKLKMVMIGQYFLLSVVYIFYITFFRSRGISF
jgi:hypothetical protein